MEQYDVLIVGGGPAGSSLAWGLRDSGLRVMVLDKQSFPRNKVCAGWITPAVLESLKLDKEQYRARNTMQPIHGFRISCMNGKQVATTQHEQPLSFGIRRLEFDHYLLQRCGADVVSEPLADLTHTGKGWIINGSYQASLLVGAGGHFCPVARHLGARPGGCRLDHEVAANAITGNRKANNRSRNITRLISYTTDSRLPAGSSNK